jgi:hypothetical protein
MSWIEMLCLLWLGVGAGMFIAALMQANGRYRDE